MGVIDFILNFAALLVWLHWRSLRFDPLARASAATLAGTLRPAEKRRKWHSWEILGAVPGILFLRSLFCLFLAAPAGWNPKINLYFVVVAFRGDAWPAALAFSILDFFKLLLVVYFWALFLVVVNRSVAESDPIIRLLRLQLGRLSRLGWWFVPGLFCLVIVCWMAACQPLLVKVGALSAGRSYGSIFGQGALLATSLLLTLKYLLPVFLLLHFVSSYVYLGSSPFWDFVSAAARSLLKPLGRLPLQVGKLDLAPLVGCIVVLVLLELLPRLILTQMPGRTIWPH